MTSGKTQLLLLLLALIFPTLVVASNDDDDWSMGPLGGAFRTMPGSHFLIVRNVPADTPAALAGLQVGDQINGAFGETFGVLSTDRNTGYRGSVQDFGNAIDRAEAGDGVLPLQIFRSGEGLVTVNVTLPAAGAFGPAYPLGSPKYDALFNEACAQIHTRIMASNYSVSYNAGRFGLCLLGHQDWNSTSGPRPYRNSINKLRDLCVTYLDSRVLAPVEPGQPGYVDAGLENWTVTSCALFIGEYRRKTGDTGVDAAVQRAAEMLANRIQHYSQTDSNGTVRNKPGLMGHGGVHGDYPHISFSGLNIINAHTLVAMAVLKGAGADFSAVSGTSELTIDQKFRMNWDWMKSCMNSGNGTDDGNVGYGWSQGGYDSAARTTGAIAGFEIYQAAGGNPPAGTDENRLGRMKAYSVRHWQRMQHAHAYTAGGVTNYQLMLPFLPLREQRFIMDNTRFFYQFHRTSGTGITYFGGRDNNGGDGNGGYLGLDNVKLYNVALAGAVAGGGLPSMPAADTSAIHIHLKSPWTSWPKIEARHARLKGLSHEFDCAVTDWQGTPLTSGVTATWTKVSGPGTVTFGSANTPSTSVSFSSAGSYRLQLATSHGGSDAAELFDFEVSEEINLPGFVMGQAGVEIFTSLPGNPVSSLTESAKYIANQPDLTGHLTSLETTHSGENYGQRVRGVIVPPATGSYRFYISSDDASQFFLNESGSDPAGVSQICQVTGATTKYNWTANAGQQSALIQLTAGQAYAFQILHKEGVGSDHCAVAWTGPGFADPTVIPGNAIARPDGIEILRQPENQTAQPGGSVTFSVLANAPGPVLYEWQLDGISYWGSSTNPTLTLPNVSTGALGAYTCIITSGAGGVTSQPATLSLDGQLVPRRGGLLREVFTGVSGSTVSSLTALARYPRFPDLSAITDSAETPLDYGDNYGQRLSGWLIPPATGQYRFYLSSDDASQFWLSTDDSPQNKSQRCQITGYSSYRTYTTGGRSALITLQAGQRYYMEILHKEGGGGDHLSLAWQMPGESAPVTGADPIPGEYLEALRFLPAPADRWKLDESGGTTADNESRALDGTHQNGVLAGQPGAAPGTRSAAYYDGSDQRTLLPAPDYNTDSLTFTAWVKRDGNQAAWAPVLFTRAGSSAAGFGFGSNNELRYHWNGNGYNFGSGLIVPDNQWCLIAMAVSPSGVTLHLHTPDGLQSATDTTAVAPEEFNGTAYLGHDPSNSTRHFKGWLDDIRAYAATLEPSDITSLYQQAHNPPEIAIISPADGGETGPANIMLQAYTGESGGPFKHVDFLEGDTALGRAESSPWSVVLPSLPVGMHTVRASLRYGSWDHDALSAPVTFETLSQPPPETITSVAAGAWNVGSTWNNGNPAPVSGVQGTGDHFRAAHTVTSDNTASNSQAIIARSLTILDGGTLDLARLHNSTTQNVTYNLPPVTLADGSGILFRASNGSSIHHTPASIAVTGNTRIRISGGNYANQANLTGPLTGGGSIHVVSESNSSQVAAGLRQISVNSASNGFTGSWLVEHTPTTGDDFAALRAGAAGSLGTSGVTLARRARLINAAAGGIDSLASVALNGENSSLHLDHSWENPSASLTLSSSTSVVHLSAATSTIGSLDQQDGTLRITTLNAGAPALVVSGNYTRNGGGISVDISGAPLEGVIYPLVAYHGTLGGQPVVSLSHTGDPDLIPSIDYGTGSDSVITVSFAAPPPPTRSLTLVATPSEAGQLSGSGEHPVNASVSISATPADGWKFTGWSGDGVENPASPQTEVMLDDSKTITANFEPIDPYEEWITGFDLEGGEAEPGSDPDGDGLTNRVEMLLGFHPADPNSRLKMDIAAITGGQVHFRVNRVVPAGTFHIETVARLGDEWQTRATLEIESAEDDHVVPLPILEDDGATRFFRLRYLPPDG